MALPTAASKDHLDAATDDPKLARAELASLVDKVNAIITHLGLSTILSSPLTIGAGLEEASGALRARAASTTQTGTARLATDAEAVAKTSNTIVLTPQNLAALGGTESLAGLLELATNAEALAGTDNQRAICAAALKHVLENTSISTPPNLIVITSSGTYTPTAGMKKALVKLIGGGGGGANANTSAAGGTGGTSNFGSYLTCTGGVGSQVSSAVGSAGGTSTGGTLNRDGERGTGYRQVGNGPSWISGDGGNTSEGKGGRGTNVISAPYAASGYGTGAGGFNANPANLGNVASGAGSGAEAVRLFTAAEIGASQSVTIGAGGTSGGTYARVGQPGVCIIMEYF